jgi:hypothetical protein
MIRLRVHLSSWSFVGFRSRKIKGLNALALEGKHQSQRVLAGASCSQPPPSLTNSPISAGLLLDPFSLAKNGSLLRSITRFDSIGASFGTFGNFGNL